MKEVLCGVEDLPGIQGLDAALGVDGIRGNLDRTTEASARLYEEGPVPPGCEGIVVDQFVADADVVAGDGAVAVGDDGLVKVVSTGLAKSELRGRFLYTDGQAVSCSMTASTKPPVMSLLGMHLLRGGGLQAPNGIEYVLVPPTGRLLVVGSARKRTSSGSGKLQSSSCSSPSCTSLWFALVFPDLGLFIDFADVVGCFLFPVFAWEVVVGNFASPGILRSDWASDRILHAKM